MTKKQKPKCGSCGETGHTKIKCPMPENEFSHHWAATTRSKEMTKDEAKLKKFLAPAIIRKNRSDKIQSNVMITKGLALAKRMGPKAAGPIIVEWVKRKQQRKNKNINADYYGPNAIRALGDFGDVRAVEPLAIALESHQQEKYLSANTSSTFKFEAKYAPENIHVDVEKALKKLEKRGELDESAVETLIKMLKSWRIRSVAAKILGKIGDKRAVKPLIRTILTVQKKSADREGNLMYKLKLGSVWQRGWNGTEHFHYISVKVRRSDTIVIFIKALGAIGDKRAVKPLIGVLGDKRISVVKAATQALGKIGDRRAVKPLVETFEKGNLGLMKVAAKAIIRIENDIEDKEKILKFLKDKDPAMIQMGVSLLKATVKK